MQHVNASSKKEGLFVVCILLYAPCNVHYVYPFIFVAIAILVQLILTASYICRKQVGHWHNK